MPVLPPETVAAQIVSVATDIGLDAAKTGMLAGRDVIAAVVEACDRVGIGSRGRTPLVVDPVAASMHGDPLLATDALDAYRRDLFPRATLITPNLDEVRLLAGVDVRDRAGQYDAAKVLHGMGPRYVLVKGGHREGAEVTDVLVADEDVELFTSPRIDSSSTHGTGCTLASAIATGIAQGMTLSAAVRRARGYVLEAIRTAPGLGHGHGPLNHAHTVRPFSG